MKTLVAVDPGLRSSGVALFVDSKLSAAALVQSPNKAGRGPYAWRDMANAVRAWYASHAVLGSVGVCWLDELVVETMMVYRGPSKVDPADLLELQAVDGALVSLFPEAAVFGYLARIWKGSVPQKVFAERVWGKLSEAERATYEPCAASLKHNIDHAVGLGRYHLGLK